MREKRFTKFLLILLLTLLPSLAKSGELEERLKGLLPEGTEWSMSVMDLNTNSVIYDVKTGNVSGLTPASLVKLFVSGASLEDASRIDMTTYISRDITMDKNILNGNLYLIGRGNALLSARRAGDTRREELVGRVTPANMM